RRGWGLMIFCARATRGRGLPSPHGRSRRSISPHPWRGNEQAWRDLSDGRREIVAERLLFLIPLFETRLCGFRSLVWKRPGSRLKRDCQRRHSPESHLAYPRRSQRWECCPSGSCSAYRLFYRKKLSWLPPVLSNLTGSICCDNLSRMSINIYNHPNKKG